MAVWLYAHGFYFRIIAKFLKVRARSVFVLVKAFAKKKLRITKAFRAKVIVELDEMWYFLGSKKDQFGSEKLALKQLSSLLSGSMTQRFRDFYQNV